MKIFQSRGWRSQSLCFASFLLLIVFSNKSVTTRGTMLIQKRRLKTNLPAELLFGNFDIKNRFVKEFIFGI
jgi:hypothetical protein